MVVESAHMQLEFSRFLVYHVCRYVNIFGMEYLLLGKLRNVASAAPLRQKAIPSRAPVDSFNIRFFGFLLGSLFCHPFHIFYTTSKFYRLSYICRLFMPLAISVRPLS